MNSKIPLLTVGMPAYNSEADIAESLNSILNQSFENFVLVISDNASTDQTRNICEAYARQDSRVHYIRNDHNIGASDNFNAVLRYAKSKYFKWASSNDYCAPVFFERCIEQLESNKDAVLAFPHTRLFSGDIENHFDYLENLATDSNDPGTRMLHTIDNIRLNNIMNGVIRTESLLKTPLIVPFFSSDSCLMCELALHGKFVNVPEYLFYRRMDQESSTSMRGQEALVEHYQPGNKKPMRFQNWKTYAYFFAAVKRAQLNTKAERNFIYKELLRRMFWQKGDLVKDLLFWKPYRSKALADWESL